jgi:hypothetical protein
MFTLLSLECGQVYQQGLSDVFSSELLERVTSIKEFGGQQFA